MSSDPSFIVIFKKHATPDQIQKYVNDLGSKGGEVTHRYNVGLKGFAAKIPASFLSSLQGDDLIEYVEPNGVVTTQ